MNLLKKSIQSFFFLLLVLPLSVFSQGFSSQTEAKLQAVLEKFQNDPSNTYVGGMSAAINVDGLAVWQGATGFAARNVDANNNLLPGGTPFTIQTLSRTYSITKTFTAALTLELAREGVLSLNDPVSKFLPFQLINPTLNSSVTIAQLLAHESGYSDFLENQDLQVAVAFQPTRVWTPFESISFATQENAPGTIRKYSSTNYIILGAIIEVATHTPVAQLFRQRFFDPLQLNSMYLAGRESIGNRGTLAAPHDDISALNPIFQFTGQPTFPYGYTNIYRFPFTAIESISYTSGGIVSNVGDVARWGNDLFGGRATSKATLDQMLQSISSTPDEDGDYL
jgi:D-alanyl-D-alanine carboxypeptidase